MKGRSLTFHQKARAALWIVAPPLLAVISLCMMWTDHCERNDRDLVLEKGKAALAWVREPAGGGYVTVAWIDDAGRQREAAVCSGRAFVRRFREKLSAGEERQRTDIKYVDDARTAPVILAEAGERERLNRQTISASMGLTLLGAAVTCFISIPGLLGAWRRRG